ncbi:MAG: DUF378 domain-containing protein [Natrialbaceae archaeon]|nr:DUF378 domain-containing protein [Natrialbaceae archaeon]
MARPSPTTVTHRINAIDWVCFALLIIGAINWGIVGIADINALEVILEPVFQADALEVVARGIYILVGLAGLYVFYPLYHISQQTRDRATASASD